MKAFLWKMSLAVALLIGAVGALFYSVGRVETDSDTPFALIDTSDQSLAPDVTLAMVNGRPFKLSDAVARGPVVLDFWATWCGPCHAEMPDLQKVYQAYGSRGVQIYGVDSFDPSRSVEQYRRVNGLTFPTVLDSSQMIHDTYGVQLIPKTLVIDKNMRIAATNEGYDPSTQGDLSQTLDKLLQEYAAAENDGRNLGKG